MAEIIQQWQYLGKPHPKLLINKAFEQCKKAGLTSLQSYVYWAEIEKESGKLDFSSYDVLVEKLKRHNLKWVPFLILGPNYATPKWFQESKESVFARCLEHQKESKIQSIWNPFLPKWVDRFLRIVAKHYQDSGILESITLGISGNWGEAIYPAEGGFYQDFHTHQGWWCGDEYAQQDFIKFALEKYESLENLNKAWGADFNNISEINFPALKQQPGVGLVYSILKKLPQQAKDSIKLFKKRILDVQNRNESFVGKQRWIDFIDWYLGSMNHWAEYWLKTARRHFPDTKIYLVTGGMGRPISGADFSAQVKIAAQYKAGVRITNQTDNYGESFVSARLISAASRFYQTSFITEEAGINQPEAVPMRIFDAVSSGANGFYCKGIIGTGMDLCTRKTFPMGEPTRGAMKLLENLHCFKPSKPLINAAVLFPNASIALNFDVLTSIYHQGSRLRDALDFDLVDENMVADKALEKYLFLIILDGVWLRKKTLAMTGSWVMNGGILIAPRNMRPGAISRDSRQDVQLFPQNNGLKRLGKGFTFLFQGSGNAYLNFISEAVYNQNKKYPWSGTLKIDGEMDRVYATQLSDKIIFYNANNFEVRKKIGSKFIKIKANSIVIAS